MELTILLPDELGRRVRRLADPNGFVTEAVLRAFRESPRPATEKSKKPSRWARLAAEIENDPLDLAGFSEQLEKDSREFRDGFAFQHDRGE